ncbi:MAG TPA: DUF2127 domain-containing protein [Myxococcales bacterium]|nr:DUF2127 domain-containing protein [Myxococcales bacterium]
MTRPIGLEAIILYKLVKAVAEAALGVAALWLVLRGAEAGAATVAQILLEHFTGAWALRAATLVVRAATSTHVKFVAAASFADAALSAIEGLSLRAGRWWGPWLVVIATASLLPWEVWEMLRRPAWGRALILLANVAVVAYLLRGVVRDHRAPARGGRPVDRQEHGP